MKTPERIIDANANRAREALRVLEEAARFIVEDPALAQALKQDRHALSLAVAALPGLIHHRDTPGDIGTQITTPTEHHRSDIGAVIKAASARLSEALRAVEEYSKALGADGDGAAALTLAATAEQLRYRGYEWAKRLAQAIGSGRSVQWRLCLLLTRSLCTHHRWQDVLEQAITSGVDAVQVREKEIDDAALLAHVQAVIALVAGRAAVIVNDRPDLALLAQADGVHLGQTDLNPQDVRRLAGDRLIIGVSTANPDQARQAKRDGADYCGVGPMFATTTKHKPVLAGPGYLADYLGWDGLPHLAIGGITPTNIGQLTAVGCKGVAVSSAICSADDPGAAASSLSEAMSQACPSP